MPNTQYSMAGSMCETSTLCIHAPGHLQFAPPIPGFVPNHVSNYMPTVRVKENEPFEVALRRFKRSCEKAGVLAEVRRREFYEKPTTERKRKAAAAVKRHAKKVQREQRRRERLY